MLRLRAFGHLAPPPVRRAPPCTARLPAGAVGGSARSARIAAPWPPARGTGRRAPCTAPSASRRRGRGRPGALLHLAITAIDVLHQSSKRPRRCSGSIALSTSYSRRMGSASTLLSHGSAFGPDATVPDQVNHLAAVASHRRPRNWACHPSSPPLRAQVDVLRLTPASITLVPSAHLASRTPPRAVLVRCHLAPLFATLVLRVGWAIGHRRPSLARGHAGIGWFG
jgi:hypothetical protein